MRSVVDHSRASSGESFRAVCAEATRKPHEIQAGRRVRRPPPKQFSFSHLSSLVDLIFGRNRRLYPADPKTRRRRTSTVGVNFSITSAVHHGLESSPHPLSSANIYLNYMYA